MPEAAGSSSAGSGAFCQKARQAGFPQTGSPLFHRGARRSVPVMGLAALTLLFILFLSAPAAQAAPGRTSPKALPFGEAEAAGVADPDLRQDLTRLSQAFRTEVTARTLARFGRKAGRRRLDLLVSPGRDYLDRVRNDALARLRDAAADLSNSQFFVYVDRNPGTQLLFLAFYDATAQTVRLLGADFVSSGKLRPGEDSFITPAGVFENRPENWGYRAEGTKNSKGWRGLGAKGSRVWDFGYQQAPRLFPLGVYDSQMRLLMHATDPDNGEPRLGGPDSKGCVRISAAANAFLDRHSVLDRHFEELAATETERRMWLLRADRVPVSHPGSYLVVGDSALTNASR